MVAIAEYQLLLLMFILLLQLGCRVRFGTWFFEFGDFGKIPVWVRN